MNELIAWLREFIQLQYQYEMERLIVGSTTAPDLMVELEKKHSFDPYLAPPKVPGQEMESDANFRKDAHPRPLFKVELREHPKFGRYARAFLGELLDDDLRMSEGWLLKQVDSEWKIVGWLLPCRCHGTGMKDGIKHKDCNGYGWGVSRKGEKPCIPPGKLLAVERFQEPDSKYRPAYYAD